MEFDVIESPWNPGDWHVEAFNEEGECYKAIISGPEAEERARAYAKWLNDPQALSWISPPVSFEK